MATSECHNTLVTFSSRVKSPQQKHAVRHCNLQASLAKERSGRAQIVASLKETISGLKAAGDVEGRLKAQAIALHGQVTAAQHAQVAALQLSTLRIQGHLV